MLKKRAAYPSSVAHIASPLAMVARWPSFSDFSVVAKSLSKNIYGDHSRRADGTG